jgi:hypothetical protein
VGTDPDIAALRSLASHHDTIESQPLAALFRRVADKLEAHALPPPDVAPAAVRPTFDLCDADGFPLVGRQCLTCGED